MIRFVFGFRQFFEGIRFWLSNKTLVRLSIWPLLINLVVCLLVFFLSLRMLTQFIPTDWNSFLYYLVMALAALVLSVLTFFMSSVTGSLIAVPFNDALAAQTLKVKLLGFQPKSGVGHFFNNISAMAKRAVLLIFLVLLIAILALLPFMSIIVAPLAAFILSWDKIDYTFDQLSYSFSQRIEFFKSHKLEVIGFSAALGLTSAIPVLNILTISGGVVAAGYFYASLRK